MFMFIIHYSLSRVQVIFMLPYTLNDISSYISYKISLFNWFKLNDLCTDDINNNVMCIHLPY